MINASSPNTIVQLTTVHQWDDIRIYHKISKSLASAGYNVHLIAPAKASFEIDGISVHALPDTSGRLERILKRQFAAFKTIMKLKPSVVHFHDPELLILALVLRGLKYIVVYDAHEDVSAQILVKHWIAPRLRLTISKIVRMFESRAAGIMSAIVGATEKIAGQLPSVQSIVLRNYPKLSEFEFQNLRRRQFKSNQNIVYVGGISIERGVGDVVDALPLAGEEIRLLLAGNFATQATQDQLCALKGWSQVDYLGWIGRQDIAATLNKACVGLLVLHPTPNHLESLPIKLFEYFAMGLPVIASDFPLWKELVGDCGILVSPEKPNDIAQAVKWILCNPNLSREMGERGRKRVLDQWNWEIESKSLISLYHRLLQNA
jgi:glycosyltransferase involved in cell wall biosynthesis